VAYFWLEQVIVTVLLTLWVIIQDEGSVHIVHVQKSADNAENVEDHHLGILESVVGRFVSTAVFLINLQLAPPCEGLDLRHYRFN
jgi:hypothetical protein